MIAGPLAMDTFNAPPPPPPPPALAALQAYASAPPPFTLPLPPPAPPTVLLPPPPGVPAPTVANEIKRINSRSKGQRGEREVVKLLQAIVDVVRQRRDLPPVVLQRNQLQSHLGGDDIHGLDAFAVEVKFQENENVPAWWRQCVAQAEKRNATPVLFYRASRSPWKIRFRAYVATPIEDGTQVEMDIETNADDFAEWFATAYAETLPNP